VMFLKFGAGYEERELVGSQVPRSRCVVALAQAGMPVLLNGHFQALTSLLCL
jgi:hypothetical protein